MSPSADHHVKAVSGPATPAHRQSVYDFPSGYLDYPSHDRVGYLRHLKPPA
jgi:hypothetical protein